MPRLLCLILILAPLAAQAEDNELPLEMNYSGTVIAGKGKPCVTLTATAAVRKLKVTVHRKSKKRAFKVASMRTGSSKTLCWKEKPGSYQYTVTLSAPIKGALSRRNITVEINYLPPIKMLLNKNEIDLEKRKLVFQLNHPAERAELTIRGKGGKVLLQTQEEYDSADAGSPLELTWEAVEGEIVRIDIKAFDTTGYWVGMAITPWAIEIPHEKVIFETDKWKIRASESPKLDAAIKQIHKALKEHASNFKVKLYVAGFTDTVGSKKHNRTLSTNRAQAIASYFSKRGVTIPIYYRGFGEEALAVPTKDQTDESRNRRALYVLAGQPPVISKRVGWGAWKSAR